MYFQSIYNDTLGQRMLQVFKKYTILVTCYLYFCVTDDKKGWLFCHVNEQPSPFLWYNHNELLCHRLCTIIIGNICGHLYFRGTAFG